MLIIGFGHKARQGKNTAALAVLNALPLDKSARMFAYADALRKEVQQADFEAGGVRELIERMDCPKLVVPECGKQRTLYQWWGTDYRRAQDPDYWVKRLLETLEREQPDIALITDVRFPNEADAIHAAGGYLVQVVRTTKPDVIVPEHDSEKALDGYTGWDFTLSAATVSQLRKQAAAAYKQIAGKHGS